jgi:hypothetical protein
LHAIDTEPTPDISLTVSKSYHEQRNNSVKQSLRLNLSELDNFIDLKN